MPFEYVDFETARAAKGLRMVVVSGVPSPWGEAAKGILHVKGIPWKAVRLDAGNDAMAEWTGERSGPVAIHDDEPPRGRWNDILLLAERIAPTPALLPGDATDRALVLGLSHEICGEMGLGWCQRNVGVQAGLSGSGGFPKGAAHYLASKYGYRAEEADRYRTRVVEILEMLSACLHAQKKAGSRFYVGDALTALDIYSAAFVALLAPLPPEQCPMPEVMRQAFTTSDPATLKAFDPILREHRDFVYAEHLELPLSL